MAALGSGMCKQLTLCGVLWSFALLEAEVVKEKGCSR